MLIRLATLFLSVNLFVGCSCVKEKTAQHQIKFATSAEYPPFEYYENKELKGFDIELARLIAKELGKEAIFEDMQFSAILPAVQSGNADAGISTITITEERKKNFDFSMSYHEESMSLIYHQDQPFTTKEQLSQKKVGTQLGTTMEIWLKTHVTDAQLVVMDTSNQAVEALKAKHVDVVMLDTIQSIEFSKKNQGLAQTPIAKSDDGYGIVVAKDSALRAKIDEALKKIQDSGELEKLKKKWLEG